MKTRKKANVDRLKVEISRQPSKRDVDRAKEVVKFDKQETFFDRGLTDEILQVSGKPGPWRKNT